MSDADPPDKIRDRKSPRDRDLHAPDPDADKDQAGDGPKQQHHKQERDAETDQPAQWCAARQNDRADLVGYRHERVTGFDDRRTFKRCCCFFFGTHRLRSSMGSRFYWFLFFRQPHAESELGNCEPAGDVWMFYKDIHKTSPALRSFHPQTT